MMNKAVKSFAILLVACTVLLSFCACGEDDLKRTIVGEWRSGEGYTLSFSNRTMSLTDENGEDLTGVGELLYTWDGSVISVELNGSSVELFNTTIFGDTLTLSYTEAVLEHFGADDANSFTLERIN